MWQGRAHSVPVQMWAGVSPITRVTTRVGPEALSLDRRMVNEDVLRAAVGPYKAVSCSYRYKATLPKGKPIHTTRPRAQQRKHTNAHTRTHAHARAHVPLSTLYETTLPLMIPILSRLVKACRSNPHDIAPRAALA